MKKLYFLLAALVSGFFAFPQSASEPTSPKGQSNLTPYFQSSSNLVPSGAQVIFNQGFEGLSNWSTTGNWEFGKPQSGIYAPEGTDVAATQLQSDYDPSQTSRMESPVISLPGNLQPDERIQFYFNEMFETESDHDWMNVYLKVGQGNWKLQIQKSGNSAQSWRTERIDLTRFAGQSIQVAFELVSDGSFTYSGWMIDNARIVRYGSAGVPKTPGGINVDILTIDAANFPDIRMEVNVTDLLGQVIPTLTDSDFVVFENFGSVGCLQVDPPGFGQGNRPVDIVFIMDNSGSMSGEQNAVQNNVYDFIDSLGARSITYNLGLTRYGQSASNGDPIITNQGSLTSDSAYFKNTIWPQNTIDGGREPGYEAIVASLNQFNYTQGAKKVLVIITDEDPDQSNTTMTQALNACVNDEAILFALTLPSYYSDFTPITSATGGSVFNITSPFDAILDSIVSQVSGTYIVNYCSLDSIADCSKRDILLYGFDGALYDYDTTSYRAPGIAGPTISKTAPTINLETNGVTAGDSVVITVNVVDTCPPVPGPVNLKWRTIGNVSYNTIAMVETAPGVYRAVISGGNVIAPGIEYYVTADDGQTVNSNPYLFPQIFPNVIPVVGNVPPLIVHTPVTSAPLNTPVTICADITDNTNNVASATLFYRKSSGMLAYVAVPMNNTVGNTYCATIPDSLITALGTDYFIRAKDDFGVASYYASATFPVIINSPVNQPPLISHVPIPGAYCDSAQTITATITDTTNIVQTASLFYRVHDSNNPLKAYTSVAMTNTAGNTYEAVIPGDSVTTDGVDYYIRATDDLGAVSLNGSSLAPLVMTCPPITDIGVVAIQNPTSPSPEGTTNFLVKLGNFGNLPVTSATLKYQINNGAVQSTSWTGLLNVYTSLNNVFAGSDVFAYADYDIKIWSEMPNGVADSDPTNDTASVTVRFCSPLVGVYTINSSAPTQGTNFNSFSDAIEKLECAGVTGPVFFDVFAGTYDEQVTIPHIEGASASNTITFRDSSLAYGNYNPTVGWTCSHNPNAILSSSSYWTLVLNGASHIRFENLGIATSYTYSSEIVQFTNSSRHIEFSGCKIDGSASSSAELVLGDDSDNSHNTFSGNCFYGGTYQVDFNSPSGTDVLGLDFTNNAFLDFEYEALDINDGSDIIISGNYFKNDTNGQGGRIVEIYSYAGNILISNNRIYNRSFDGYDNAYGFYLYGNNSDVKDLFLQNNAVTLISTGTSSGSHGAYVYRFKQSNLYHNSFNLVGLDDVYGLYITGSDSMSVENNTMHIESNEDGSNTAGIYSSNINDLLTCDYNNIYLENLGNYSEISYTSYLSLADFQSAFTGFGMNSSEFHPEFFSDTNLHVNSVYYDNAGTPVGVTSDFEGDTRSSSTPDIGADEFTPFGTDAWILWNAPVGATPSGSFFPEVVIVNNRVDLIQSVNISAVFGGDTVTETFSGLNLASKDSTTLTFSSPLTSVSIDVAFAYINLVNGAQDGRQTNDTTAQYPICVPMAGNYTLDTTLPVSSTNFQSIYNFFDRLECAGVSGPVTLNIAPGTYFVSENVASIMGTSSSNTITIRSSTGDSTDVIFNGLADNSPLFTLEGVSYLTFESVTFSTVSRNSYTQTILTNGGMRNFTVQNCRFLGSSTNTYDQYSAIQMFDNFITPDTAITIARNHFDGIPRPVYMYFASSYRGFDIQVQDNIMRDVIYGIDITYTEMVDISGNRIYGIDSTITNSKELIYLSRCLGNNHISGNVVENINSFGPVTGIYVNDLGSTSSSDSTVIANNIVNIGLNSAQTNTYYDFRGIYTYTCYHVNVDHNTVQVRNAPDEGYALYAYSGRYNNYRNNIFVTNSGQDQGVYIYDYYNDHQSDYNHFYILGQDFGRYYSTTYATFADWQTNAGQDLNSTFNDPYFPSMTNLRSLSLDLDNSGTPVGVSTDIEGTPRSATTPDKGAYEFDGPQLDAGIIGLDDFGFIAGNYPVVIDLQNFGYNTITSVALGWSIDGQYQGTFNWTGTLSSNSIDSSIQIGTYNFGFGVHQVAVFVESVNGTPGDGNSLNDTIQKPTEFFTGPRTLPYCQDFENGLEDFQNGTSADYNWIIGPTPTTTGYWETDTGSDGGQFAYVEEDSIANDGDEGWMYATFDLTGALNPKMVFNYFLDSYSSSSNYTSMLYVDVNDTGWRNVWGDTASSSNNDWMRDTLWLDSLGLLSDTVQIRFRHVAPVYEYYSFAAIDEVCLTETYDYDVSIAAIETPSDSAYGLSSGESITVRVKNEGLLPASNFPVVYQLNGGTPVIETFTGTLNYSEEASLTFTTPADFNYTDTTYTLVAYTDMMNDQNRANDTTVKSVYNYNAVIFDGGNDYANLPVEPYYGYTYSQSIFYSSEISLNGAIEKIAWYYEGNSWTDDIRIFMANTTKTEFNSSNDWVPLSSLTEVYDGQLSVSSTAGWVILTLDNPFQYDPTQNLIIAVVEETPGYHSSSDDFSSTSRPETRSIVEYRDNTPIDPAMLSNEYGSLKNYVPNTILFFTGPLPLQVNIAGDDTVCVGATANIAANGVGGQLPYSYSWSNGATTPSISPTVSQTSTYSVTITDGSGLTSSNIYTVNTYSTPNVSFSPISDFCQGDVTSIDLTSFVSQPAGINGNFYWNNDVISSNVTPGSWPTGANTVTYIYTDDNGCTDSVSTVIQVNPKPIAVATDLEVCEDSAPFALANATPAGGVYSGAGVVNGMFDPSLLLPDAHPVTYIYTDANGCSDTVVFTVTIHALPTVSLTGLQDICIDNGIVNLSGGMPAGGTYSGIGVSNNTFDPSNAGAGVHPITYTYTDTNGCVNTATDTIEVYPLPVVSFTLQAGICIDDTPVTLSASPVGGTFSGTGVVSGNTFDPAVATSGMHTITYTYTDGNGCTQSVNQTIEVYDLPTLQITSVSSACVGDAPIVLSATPSGGTFTVNGVSASSIAATAANVGTHVVSYSYTDGNGCSNTVNDTVIIHALPTVSVSALPDLCPGDSPLALAQYAAPAGGTFSGSGVSNGAFDPSIPGAGTSMVYYTYTDAVTGCTNIDSAQITVNVAPIASITPVADLCEGDPSITLSGAPVGGTFSGPGVSGTSFDPVTAGVGTHTVSYVVSGPNGCTDSVATTVVVHANPTLSFSASDMCIYDTPQSLSAQPIGGTYTGLGVIGNTFDAGLAGSGTHIITYSYTDANGCTNSIQDTITVTEIIVDAGLGDTLCENDIAVTLSGSPSGGSYSGVGIVGNTFDPSVAGSGTHEVVYTVSSQSCTFTDTVEFVVNAAPVVSITPLGSVCANAGSLTLSASPSGGTFSGSGVSGNTFDPSSVTGGYSIISYTVTNSDGCTAVAEDSVVVLDAPAIPVISQNGDTLFSSVTGSNYQWYDDQMNPIAGATDEFYVAAQNGDYYVEVYNADGCSSLSSVYTATGIGLIDFGTDAKLDIYPNPNTGRFGVYIEVNSTIEFDIQIHNLLGQLVYEDNHIQIDRSRKIDIDMSNVQSGVYFITLKNGGNQISKRIIIED